MTDIATYGNMLEVFKELNSLQKLLSHHYLRIKLTTKCRHPIRHIKTLFESKLDLKSAAHNF